MFFKKITRPSILAILLVACSMTFWASRVSDPRVTSWDVFGYYMYLPQTFLQGDPGNARLEHLEEMRHQYSLGPAVNMVHKTDKNYYLSQYGFGMAIFYFPAFATGHLVASITGHATDGYSPPYQYSMIWWQVIYMVLSFIVLRKVLLHFFDERLTALLLLTVCFGTNYYLYATTVYGMSHAYLFLAYTLVLYYTIRWHESFAPRYSIALGLVLGLMIISRPSEVLACFIPALWGMVSWKTFIEKIFLLWKNKKAVIVLGAALLLLPCLQLLYWKIYSGHFLYYSYRNPGEGFEFGHPHTFDFLFSFRKGWFIYTPIMLVAVCALFLTFYRRKDFTLPLVVFTCVNVYVLSCWSTWWYAASFGSRPVIQSYPVYLLGLGVLFAYLHQQKNIFLRLLPLITCSLAIVLNLFQAWQARHNILHPERMTRDYYFATFGKTEIPWGADTLLLVNRERIIDTALQEPQRYSLGSTHSLQKMAQLPSAEFTLDNDTIYGPVIEIPYSALTSTDHAWLRIRFEVKDLDSTGLEKLELAFCFFNKKHVVYAWNTSPVKGHVKPGEAGWQSFSIYFLTPDVRLTSDRFHTKLMKEKTARFLIRNFEVDAYIRKGSE